MEFDYTLETEKWRVETERSCNGVYSRNNGLLSLKRTEGRSHCLSYPECVCTGWKEDSEENWKRLGTRMGWEKRPEKLQLENAVPSEARGVIWIHGTRKDD